MLCAAALQVACVREPLTGACPEVAAGELVITEIRGAQPGYYQWIELYNASERPLELGGLALGFVLFDGDAKDRILVRDADLVVEPGEYVVLGVGPASTGYIDYDFTVDFHAAPTDKNKDGEITDDERYPLRPSTLYRGFYDVIACGELVDRVRVDSLPAAGTLFWPGEPDADANDGDGWCVDDFTVDPGATGVRGTPKEANPPCP